MVDYSKWNDLSLEDSEDETDAAHDVCTESLSSLARTPTSDIVPMDDAGPHMITSPVDFPRGPRGPVDLIPRGHVLVSRADSRVYPPAVFTDPQTFEPEDGARDEDGRVRNWGIADSPDGFMARLQGINSFSYYSEYGEGGRLLKKGHTPQQQFVSMLEKRKRQFISSPQCLDSTENSLTIRMELVGVPDVWRRFKVPASTPLFVLHDQIICPIMGWSRAYHSYAFEDPRDGAAIGPSKYSGGIDSMHVDMMYSYLMDDRDVPLAALLREKDEWCFYVYDLGDGWEHRLLVEDVLPKSRCTPELLEGGGACPPEDSNGLEGKGNRSYAEFLAQYRRHPASCRAAIREMEKGAVNYSEPWIGPPRRFEPLTFDLQWHRDLLNAMLAGPTVQKPKMRSGFEFKESNNACAVCGQRLVTLKTCARCEAVFYCSKACQKQDYKQHKKLCKALGKA